MVYFVCKCYVVSFENVYNFLIATEYRIVEYTPRHAPISDTPKHVREHPNNPETSSQSSGTGRTAPLIVAV